MDPEAGCLEVTVNGRVANTMRRGNLTAQTFVCVLDEWPTPNRATLVDGSTWFDRHFSNPHTKLYKHVGRPKVNIFWALLKSG